MRLRSASGPVETAAEIAAAELFSPAETIELVLAPTIASPVGAVACQWALTPRVLVPLEYSANPFAVSGGFGHVPFTVMPFTGGVRAKT